MISITLVDWHNPFTSQGGYPTPTPSQTPYPTPSTTQAAFGQRWPSTLYQGYTQAAVGELATAATTHSVTSYTMWQPIPYHPPLTNPPNTITTTTTNIHSTQYSDYTFASNTSYTLPIVDKKYWDMKTKAHNAPHFVWLLIRYLRLSNFMAKTATGLTANIKPCKVG